MDALAQHDADGMDFAALVNRCLEGDQDAWDGLLAPTRAPLRAAIKRRLARSGVRDQDLAEDILAEVWASLPDRAGGRLRAYKLQRESRGAGLDRNSFEAYLARRARSRVKEHLRSETSRRKRERAAARPEAYDGGGSAAKDIHEWAEAVCFLLERVPGTLFRCYLSCISSGARVRAWFQGSPTKYWQHCRRVWKWAKALLANWESPPPEKEPTQPEEDITSGQSPARERCAFGAGIQGRTASGPSSSGKKFSRKSDFSCQEPSSAAPLAMEAIAVGH
jgi:DNA-directed RNA polymerase specialized sigma24 family protein